MTETELDKSRRYLVPVGRLLLPDEPDLVHLSLYEWFPTWDDWATGLALCGRSTEQGALPEGTEVTCPDCQSYQPKYQAILTAQAAAAEGEQERRRRRDAAGDTVENGAWHTVWLRGQWRWITSKMTTPQREYAADCVAAYSRHLSQWNVEPVHTEPEGLRWWRDDR